MKKTIYLIGILGIIVIITITVLLLRKSQTTQQTQQGLVPTEIPIPTAVVVSPGINTVPLKIVSTQPANQQKNTPVAQTITITFNRLFTLGEISIVSWPVIAYTTKIDGKNLIIIPKTGLQANTIYSYSINYTAGYPSETNIFSTVGSNPTAPSTYVRTGSPDDPYKGVESPDLYLSNRTPYTGTTFSVVNDFSSTPKDHFFFTVTLSGADQTQDKQDFMTWLNGLGFSDAVIQSLDIRYQ